MDTTAQALIREAASLNRQGRLMDAIRAYRGLLEQWPQLPNSWYNLAVLQRRTGDFDAALRSYQEALDRGIERPEEVHLNRGVIHSDYLRQYEAAEQELVRALTLNPRYVPALLNLGNLHEDLGRKDAAAAVYERILALDPTCFIALVRAANLVPATTGADPWIARLERALDDPDAQAADRAAVGFALGRLLDGCGSHAAAFKAYTNANHQSRASAPPGSGVYDREAEGRFIDRLIAAFPAVGQPSAAPPRSPVPVFVCGMFRSGSTLLEQMLGRHPRVAAGGEMEFIPRAVSEILAPFPESMRSTPPASLTALAARYLETLARSFPGADFVTDKRPDNFLYIGLIKTLFPEAKIVHTVRNALDNCLSIFFLHLDQSKSYALDLSDIGHHYRQYRRLMQHWKTLYGPDIVDVSYDEFVHEPKSTAERLLQSLGLTWDDHCLGAASAGPVKTASVWQVREPIYQRSSGRARHYAEELRPLRDDLAN